MKDNLEDICLDNPQGPAQLKDICSRGIDEGWLDSDWDTQALSVRTSSPAGSHQSIQVIRVLMTVW